MVTKMRFRIFNIAVDTPSTNNCHAMKYVPANTSATDTSTRSAAHNLNATGIAMASVTPLPKMEQEEQSPEKVSSAVSQGPFVFQRKESASGLSKPGIAHWQPTVLPVIQLQQDEGNYRMRTGGNLRQNNNNYSVIRRLAENENVQVISKGAKVSNFKAGLVTNEHSWVRTNRAEEGWIEDSKLVVVPQAAGAVHAAATAATVPAPVAQPARVNRLQPDLKLPPKNPEWNYGRDEGGERSYNEIERIIDALEDLQNYQNSHPVVNPAPYTLVTKKEFSSDYHRAGDEAAQKYYAEAQAAGYNLNDAEVRRLLDIAVALLHSHYYQSMVTTTGILLA